MKQLGSSAELESRLDGMSKTELQLTGSSAMLLQAGIRRLLVRARKARLVQHREVVALPERIVACIVTSA